MSGWETDDIELEPIQQLGFQSAEILRVLALLDQKIDSMVKKLDTLQKRVDDLPVQLWFHTPISKIRHSDEQITFRLGAAGLLTGLWNANIGIKNEQLLDAAT
jgi:hypothetical protein